VSGTINLRDITHIERIDLKPYCLVLETKDKQFYLSLKNDEELYSWQDDIYSRSPLMGVGNPTDLVHQTHVGFDPVTGAFTVHPAPFSSGRFDRVALVSYVGFARGMAKTLDKVRDHPGGLR